MRWVSGKNNQWLESSHTANAGPPARRVSVQTLRCKHLGALLIRLHMDQHLLDRRHGGADGGFDLPTKDVGIVQR